ncbi:MAG: SMI1/KNR4 family protein [Planctomycetes bacterium]|nr:SMI1/KNR4 family protein [Planctomycetota bacterium]
MSRPPDTPGSHDPAAAIAAILRRLATLGWHPGLPTSAEQLEAVESDLRVPLPYDYRCYLAAVGRGSGRPSWRGLWHIDEIVSLNRTLPVFHWFGGVIGIGNEGFFVYALDYRHGLPPSLVSLGLSCSEPDDVEKEGDSFLEWLERTLPGNC